MEIATLISHSLLKDYKLVLARSSFEETKRKWGEDKREGEEMDKVGVLLFLSAQVGTLISRTRMKHKPLCFRFYGNECPQEVITNS